MGGWGFQRGAEYVGDFLALPAEAGNDPLPRGETGYAAAVEGTNYPLARPGWRRAVCRLLPLRCSLSGGLYLAPGHPGRPWQTLSGILSHKFLALHLLRLLRRSLPDLRDPAHARLRDG